MLRERKLFRRGKLKLSLVALFIDIDAIDLLIWCANGLKACSCPFYPLPAAPSFGVGSGFIQLATLPLLEQ